MRADVGSHMDLYCLPDVGDPDYDYPVRTVDFGLYVRNTDRTRKLRLYYGKGKSESPFLQKLYGVGITVSSIGTTWRQGTEIVSQGFVYARLIDDSWVQLISGATLSLGDMAVNSYKDFEIKINITDPYPLDESAETRHGVIHFKFLFGSGYMVEDASNPALYGSSGFGLISAGMLPIYQSQSPTDVEWILARARVLTASEGSGLSDVITISNGV